MAEAGEQVELARDGKPVVRLVPIAQAKPGELFLAARGSLRGQIVIHDESDLDEAELAAIYDNPIDPTA